MLLFDRIAPALSRSGREHVSTSLYAPNEHDYGNVNYLLSADGGDALLLKKCRDDAYAGIFEAKIEKLRQVVSEEPRANLREQIVLGEVMSFGHEKFVAFKYYRHDNLYMHLRNKVLFREAAFAGCLRKVLNFCLRLETLTSIDRVSAADFIGRIRAFQEAYGHRDIGLDLEAVGRRAAAAGCRKGIVHYDLAPANVLWDGRDVMIVDWEFWDFGPSLENFFDVLITFGALYSASMVRRRGVAEYLTILRLLGEGRAPRLRRALAGYLCESGHAALDPESAWSLFVVFLIDKSMAQCVTYGERFDLDKFWFQVLRLAATRKPAFESCWRRLQE